MVTDDLAARPGYEAHDFHQYPDMQQWVDAGLVCRNCHERSPDVLAVTVPDRVLEFWCGACWEAAAHVG
jgi:hypothetical protein